MVVLLSRVHGFIGGDSRNFSSAVGGGVSFENIASQVD
jgi:hypothetical protein